VTNKNIHLCREKRDLEKQTVGSRRGACPSALLLVTSLRELFVLSATDWHGMALAWV